MDAEDFFAAPAYADREPSRPRAVNPATGKEQSWTRASNYAAELDSPFGLLKRNQRKLIEGLSQRPDLARLLLVGSVIDDKAKQDEIIAAAMAVAEADSAANNGTASHTALVRSWLGEPVPEEFHPLVKSFVRALKDNGLKPKAAEQRVLNLAFDSMGHFDWVFEEADGTEVIGDVKTGRLDVAKRKFAVQLAMYDGADFVLHKDGRIEPTPWKLSHTHAVLVHVDLEHNAVSIYRVDLHIGRHGAALAEQVRRWHKLDPLTPYVPPLAGTQQTNARQPELSGTVAQQVPTSTEQTNVVKNADGSTTIYQDSGSSYNGFESQEKYEAAAQKVGKTVPAGQTFTVLGPNHPVAETSAVIGSIEIDEPRPASAADALSQQPKLPDEQALIDEAVMAVGGAPSKPYDIDARFAELMTLEKAQLQSVLKNKHNWRDDAHNRRWLARAIIVLEQGWTDVRQIKNFAAAKDPECTWKLPDGTVKSEAEMGGTGTAQPMTVPEAAQAVAEVDRTVARRSIALEAIAGAKSVAALAAFHQDWTGRYGEAAWTDELAALAKARTADLDVLSHNGIRLRIDGATKPEDLANIWNDVTIGGSAPSKWDPFDHHAKSKLQQLREQQPPVAANPFGG